MKKFKLIKYDRYFIYASDENSEVYGNIVELQATLTMLIQHLKKLGISEEDIMLGVDCGLKGEKYALEKLMETMKEYIEKANEEEDNQCK